MRLRVRLRLRLRLSLRLRRRLRVRYAQPLPARKRADAYSRNSSPTQRSMGSVPRKTAPGAKSAR